jgi:D-glycerate 3-kinase
VSPEPDPKALAAALAEVAAARRMRHHGPCVIGLCGAQGSGKSTLASALRRALVASGVSAATLSIDDLYLTRAERHAMARNIHPLFATRGVPGTHDIARGEHVLAALDRGEAVALLQFDKAADDRMPESAWPLIEPPLDVLIFEGWCVGARPEDANALASPINKLEAEEDRNGIWRSAVNDALARGYQRLFARLDRLILLAAPSFGIVSRWRGEQEVALRRTRPGGSAIMDSKALDRFVQHYERITRHILLEMPARADLVLHLDDDRHVAGYRNLAI